MKFWYLREDHTKYFCKKLNEVERKETYACPYLKSPKLHHHPLYFLISTVFLRRYQVQRFTHWLCIIFLFLQIRKQVERSY